MKFYSSNVIAKTILAGLLMLSLVACPPAPADLTPDSFVVPPVTGAALGMDVPSASFTVSGITAPVPISVIGGKYQIDTAAFTSTSGTVSSGQTVKVSLLSSNLFGTTKTATITVGGITAPFSVTTRPVDTTPDAFSFPPIPDATPNIFIFSGLVTITGIDSSAKVTISGGLYSINGGTFTDSEGTITNGQAIEVKGLSSSSFLTPTNTTLTIGGVSATFTVTTRPEDQTPDAFSFIDAPNAARNTQVDSNTLTIGGFETAPISIVGGFYRINNGSSFITSPGTIKNNDTIQLSIGSPISPATSQKVTVTIGTVSTTWTVTTNSLVTVLATESFPIPIANGSGISDAIYGADSLVNFSVPNFSGVVLDKVALQVKITHPQRNDLEIVLFDPATPTKGSNTIYFASPAQAASNNMDATFDENAPNAFIASCSAATTANSCTGLIRPFQSFTFLNVLGQNPSGNWRVRVRDGYRQASGGQIVSMSLRLTYKPVP